MKVAMEKQQTQFQTKNQYWHKINSNNEEKIDYLCWGVQQINPFLKARLPEDIPEWMRNNVQAGRGRLEHLAHVLNAQADVLNAQVREGKTSNDKTDPERPSLLL
ncbi:hypothetical protein PIB30_039187, partial [Stylosanthes scabra]|nr:hypothetical protein [Stylosanthes scabra]